MLSEADLRWMSVGIRKSICEVWEVERARGGCRRERVERACIDTGQSSWLIVAGVTAIKQSLSLPKADREDLAKLPLSERVSATHTS